MTNRFYKYYSGILYPSQVTDYVSPFDRFAARCSRLVSKSAFFSFSLLMIILWFPSYFLFDNVDSWQMVINTSTTICTWIFVSLLSNTQTRDTNAVHHKMNAMAQALGNFIDTYQETLPDHHSELALKLQHDLVELRAAVGLEERESS